MGRRDRDVRQENRRRRNLAAVKRRRDREIADTPESRAAGALRAAANWKKREAESLARYRAQEEARRRESEEASRRSIAAWRLEQARARDPHDDAGYAARRVAKRRAESSAAPADTSCEEAIP